MTNGGSPSHGKKQGKGTAIKKAKAKDRTASLKRKGLLPARLTEEKTDGAR